MSAHTPGPWQVGDKDRNEQPTVMGREWLVAVVPHGCLGSMESVAEANARLIAAAPDLLKALEDVANSHWIPSDHPLRVQARRVIAKARGGE